MTTGPLHELRDSLSKVCHDEVAFRVLLDKLSPEESLEAQVFIWDYLMRLAQDLGVPVQRHDVTKRMVSTPSWQYSVGCNERMDYCRANICIYSNPSCASAKLKGQMESLRRLISELLSKA
jgi:hypothetical protein